MPAQPINCADCGCLARRVLNPNALIEVDPDDRVGANAAGRGSGTDGLPKLAPICAAGAYDLRAEYRKGFDPEWLADSAAPSMHHAFPAFKAVIDKPRECDAFIKYKEGLTPREHVDMNIIALEKQRIAEQNAADKRLRIMEFVFIGIVVPLLSTILGAILAVYLVVK